MSDVTDITAPAVAAADPALLGALDSGSTRHGAGSVIMVYFAPDGTTLNAVTSDGWSNYETQKFMEALALISAVANVTFVETNDPNADFQLVLDENELSGAGDLGHMQGPSGSNPSIGVFNAGGYGWNASGGLEHGGLGSVTIVQQVLYALGLDYPHAGSLMAGVSAPFGDYGDFDLNQGVYTTMSFNDGYLGAPAVSFDYGHQSGPMALDIAVLQAVYGPNTTHNSGDNTYVLPDGNAVGSAWQAIWDTGGLDAITYSGTRDSVIDLRAATLDYALGGGGFISAAGGISGGFSIANGVVIENAATGSGDDVLNGNDAGNELAAGAGADVLRGFDGADSLYGGAGNDRSHGNQGDDSLLGEAGNDALFGGLGADTLDGGSGNDRFEGGAGGDSMIGGDGLDMLDYRRSGAAVAVDLGAGTASGGDAAGDQFASVEWLHGSDHGDTLGGDGGRNYIYGSAGGDTISGGAGVDILAGGAGADVITGGDGKDMLDYRRSDAGVLVDLATGSASGGHATGDTFSGVERLGGSGHDDVLSGDDYRNFVFGRDGADVIDGGGRNDLLRGGAGDDRFLFHSFDGEDTIEGGSGSDTVDFSGFDRGDFIVVDLGSGDWQVTEMASGDQDVLSSIEILLFDDVTLLA